MCEPRQRQADHLEGPQANSREEPLSSACSALASGTPPCPEPLLRLALSLLTSSLFSLEGEAFSRFEVASVLRRNEYASRRRFHGRPRVSFGGGGFQCAVSRRR